MNSFRLAMAAAIMATLVLLPGCITVTPAIYAEPGAANSGASPAIVELVAKSGYLGIHTLDGKGMASTLTSSNRGFFAIREYQLVPGPHTLEGVAEVNPQLMKPFRYSQNFEAGARYRITSDPHGYQIEVSFERIDGKQ